jgi:hypothetical protein
MDSFTSDATTLASASLASATVAPAALAFVHVAIADLEVYERAVTLQGAGGELCPSGGWANQPMTSSVQGTIRPASSGTTFAAMDYVRNFKSRIGSHAISGTG